MKGCVGLHEKDCIDAAVILGVVGHLGVLTWRCQRCSVEV